MSKINYAHYKKLLLEHKSRILNGGVLAQKEDLVVSQDDLFDEADLANSVIAQQVTFQMRARDYNTLRMIDEALMRIEDGTYGICEDCGDPISSKRLEHAPWSEFCITHAEEHERDHKKSA